MRIHGSTWDLPLRRPSLVIQGLSCNLEKVLSQLENYVNPSAPQPKGWGPLRVDPERRFSTPLSNAGLGAAERIKKNLPPPVMHH